MSWFKRIVPPSIFLGLAAFCILFGEDIRVHVPLEDLPAVRKQHPKAVLLSAEEYRQLLAKGEGFAKPHPHIAALKTANYWAKIEGKQLLVSGELDFVSLFEKPIDLVVPFAQIGLQKIQLEDHSAPLCYGDNGRLNLRLPSAGVHKVQISGSVTLRDTPGGGSEFRFQVPGAVSGKMVLMVSGDQEIRSNVPVLSEVFDSEKLETRIELAVGGHQSIYGVLLGNGHREDQRPILLGNSAITVNMDPAGQMLDAHYSIQVLRQGVRKFVFQMNDGWTVLDVKSPDLVRWSVESGEEGLQKIKVDLRNAVTGTKQIQFRALAPTAKLQWSAPSLVLQDADFLRGHLLVDPGATKTFRAEALQELIRQDLSTASQVAGLTSSNGRLYFHWGTGWTLDLVFADVLLERHSDEQQLLITAPGGLVLKGEFKITAVGHEMAHAVFILPPVDLGWELDIITLNGQKKGFEYRIREIADGQELRVDFENAVQAEGLASMIIQLKKIPADWSDFLTGNETEDFLQKTFPLIHLDADKTKGLVAFSSLGHLEVEPGELPENWTQINVGQLGALGLGKESRSAYRYTESVNGVQEVTIRRAEPRFKGESVGLYTLQQESLRGSFAMNMEISRAPAKRIFVLAEKSLGKELSLGIKGKRLPASRIVESGEDTIELTEAQEEKYNLWQIDLDRGLMGNIQILASFRQSIEAGELDLPLIRLAGADQLVEYAAIEAAEEFAVELEVKGVREVDPIDLPELPTEARRVLGAYRFLPETAEGGGIQLKVSTETLKGYGIPSVLALQARLTTQVGVLGSQQTVATWRVSNVSRQFVEVRLPEGAELWSAKVSGQPVKPKVGQEDSLLLTIPLTRDPIEVTVVYYVEPSKGKLGKLDLLAPKLLNVPVNETRWDVYSPQGYELSDYDSNLTNSQVRQSEVTPALYHIWDYFILTAAIGVNMDQTFGADSDGYKYEEKSESAEYLPEPEMAAMEEEMPQSAVAEPEAEIREEMKRDQKKVYDQDLLDAKERDWSIVQTGEHYSAPKDLQKLAFLPGSASKAQGRFTLPVELVLNGSGKTFQGLGTPKLQVQFTTKVSQDQEEVGGIIGFLSAILAVWGLRKWRKLTYFISSIIICTLLALWFPGLGLFANGFFAGTFVFLHIWPLYLIGKWILTKVWKGLAKGPLLNFRKVVLRTIFSTLALCFFIPNWNSLEAKPIFVPYGEEGPAREGEEARFLLPYDTYIQLWNQANPSGPLALTRIAPRIFLREPRFDAKLVDAENFELNLSVHIEVEGSEALPLPLAFGNVAIKTAALNDEPVPLTAGKDGGILFNLKPGTQGVLKVSAVTKPLTRGRTGNIELQIPSLPAAILHLDLSDPDLEVEAPGVHGIPVRTNNLWQMPVGNLKKLSLRWRPKVGLGAEDRTLTADSSHQIHTFHWGIIGVSTINYRFSGGEHGRFPILMPSGLEVSNVETANLRDHELLNEVELDGKSFQGLEVRLHRAVKKQHSVVIRWVAPFPEESVTSRLWLPRAAEVGRESGRVELHSALGVSSRVVSVEGGRRMNRNANSGNSGSADSSRFRGAYEWPFRPFALSWEVQREINRPVYQTQQLVRISPEEVQLLSNVTVEAEEGLIFGSTFILPVGYEVLNVVGADLERWHIQEEGMGNLLHVDYRVARLKTSLAVVLVKEDPELAEFVVPVIRAASAEGQLIETQSGQLAVQVAPALEAETLEANELKTRPRNAVASWLESGQVNAVQFAYDSDGPDAALKLGIQQRPTDIRLEMLVGVLVEETVAHFTYRLRFNVEGSPLDQLSFTLPEEVAGDVALVSPALRGIQHESIADGLHQWKVSLVNEVTGLVDIGVNFSRPIQPETNILDIPELKTTAGAGYRAVLAIQNESRHQLEFQGSAGLRPATVEEQQELLDESLRKSLQFVQQVFQADWEANLKIQYAQETKRLEAVVDLLTLNTFISKSGQCVYEVTLSLQNRAEQFIEIQIPETLQLWSAEVDGEPVKPVFPKSAEENHIAIPLVKTTIAGLPFDARLYLAGTLSMELKPGKRIEPPSIKVLNIPVKRTNWSLHLPDELDYHDLDVNMDPVAGSAELLSYGIEAKLEQLKRVSRSSSKKKFRGKGKGYDSWKSSVNKELGVLQEQIDYNDRILNENPTDFTDEDRGRLGQQLAMQRQALQTLNSELTEGKAGGEPMILVNGVLNASCINPGLSEWDRNGALNILPKFVSRAQDTQFANLEMDYLSNTQQLEVPQAQITTNAQLQLAEPTPQQRAQVQAPPSSQNPSALLGREVVAQTELAINSFDIPDQQIMIESNIVQLNDALEPQGGRVQQLQKRQQELSRQIGNLADNRLNRFFTTKGLNTSNAINQVKVPQSPATKGGSQAVPGSGSDKVQYYVADEAKKAGVISVADGRPEDLLAFSNSATYADPGAVAEMGDTVFTFAAGDFSYTDEDGDALDRVRLQAATAGKLWVDADDGVGNSYASFIHADAGVQVGSGAKAETGTYSLKIPFPKGGQTFDFSYPGDDPKISLRIRDLDSRNRNYTSVILLGLLGVVFGASRIFTRKPAN